jgi:hypothetical protein
LIQKVLSNGRPTLHSLRNIQIFFSPFTSIRIGSPSQYMSFGPALRGLKNAVE